MGIEARRNGNLYYYEKLREGGRVVSIYRGGSEFVTHIAPLIEQRRKDQIRLRQLEQVRLETESKSIRQTDEEVEMVCALIELAVAAHLRRAGYHCHKGEWRKSRMSAKLSMLAPAGTKKSDRDVREFIDRAIALMSEANGDRPDAKEIAELRELLEQHPEQARWLPGLAGMVQRRLIEKVIAGGGNQELVVFNLRQMRQDMGWGQNSGAERLLIERVVMCWLRLQWVEHYNASLMGPGSSYKESEHADKLLTRAQNRFIKAYESLERVRRLRLRRLPANDSARGSGGLVALGPQRRLQSRDG